MTTEQLPLTAMVTQLQSSISVFSIRLLLGLSSIGWVLVFFNSEDVPGTQGDAVWRVLAAAGVITSLVVAVKPTATTAATWATASLVSGVSRSWVYARESVWNPLGVWLLVITGTLAMILALALIVADRSAPSGRKGQVVRAEN